MGLRDQLGIGVEAAYGTPVAATRGFEFTSDSLKRRNRTIQSTAVGGYGRRPARGRGRELVGHDGGGDVGLEVAPDGYGIWFAHALGTTATSQPNAANDPAVFEHRFTMGPAHTRSLTIQKAVENEVGVLVPWTFAGCVITGWQLSVSVDGFLMFTPTIDARQVLVDDAATATLALQTVAVAATAKYTFQHAALTLDGAPVAAVSSPSITGDNVLKTDRYFVGNQGLKDRPRPSGWPTLGGQFAGEFVSREAQYDAYASDTGLALALTFEGATLPGTTGLVEELTVTLPEIHLDGDTPTMGDEIAEISVPFTALDDDVNEPIEVLLRNRDATP